MAAVKELGGQLAGGVNRLKAGHNGRTHSQKSGGQRLPLKAQLRA